MGWRRNFVALLLLVAIALMQDRLLYFPTQLALADTAVGRMQPWPSAQEFRGFLAEPAGPARATAIVFHGTPATPAIAATTPSS